MKKYVLIVHETKEIRFYDAVCAEAATRMVEIDFDEDDGAMTLYELKHVVEWP